MDDMDLLTAVREDFAGVRMTTRVEAVLADGGSRRRKRNRRRVYGAGAMAAAAAVAVIGGVTLASGTAGADTGARYAQLTAWTVQKEPGGTIDVTIHDLKDLTALEQKLAADGAPAEVTSRIRHRAACLDHAAMNAHLASVITNGPTVPNGLAFVIHPADIPSGTKLLLDMAQSGRFSQDPGGGGPTRVMRLAPQLWPLTGGARMPRIFGKWVGVAVGLGLVYDSGNC